MNFLESLWRKLFKKEDMVLVQEYWHKDGARAVKIGNSQWQAYDPSEDPEKILNGEVESYFE